jgi:hypothetical protein
LSQLQPQIQSEFYFQDEQRFFSLCNLQKIILLSAAPLRKFLSSAMLLFLLWRSFQIFHLNFQSTNFLLILLLEEFSMRNLLSLKVLRLLPLVKRAFLLLSQPLEIQTLRQLFLNNHLQAWHLLLYRFSCSHKPTNAPRNLNCRGRHRLRFFEHFPGVRRTVQQ